MVTKNDITNILKTIPDPELDISILDLGLIYSVVIDKNGLVKITMTLTSVGCPLFSMMEESIKEKIRALPGVKEVTIDLTFEPPWSMDKMSKSARKKLGML